MCIFAKQLQYILQQKKKTFWHLRNISVEYPTTIKDISSEQLRRLHEAASGNCNISVALNSHELEAVQEAFQFSQEDIRRMRAALVAESILRFLLNRIEAPKAVQISETFFHLFFDANDSEFITLRSRMIKDIRADERTPEQIVADASGQSSLEAAIEAYEHALLWLDTARVEPNPILRRGYLAMVSSLLTSAHEQLTEIPDPTAQIADWQVAVVQAMTDIYNIEET